MNRNGWHDDLADAPDMDRRDYLPDSQCIGLDCDGCSECDRECGACRGSGGGMDAALRCAECGGTGEIN